jgi:branched-chain amino acid transport system permease protein
VSSAVQFYISTLLVYLGVDIMAVWGLNVQFGVTGVMNFAFILFQAVGAYTAGIVTLGPSSGNGGFQAYVGGFRLPFPLPLVAAGLAGALAALLIGVIVLRRLRGDYQALVLLVLSLIATGVAQTDLGLVNGPAGLSLIPQPLVGALNLSPLGYQWVYVGITVAVCVVIYFFVHRVTGSPLGRALRSVRENETAAAALGKNTDALRLLSFVMGGAIAGVSGAVLVEFIGAWAPGSWLYPETFTLLTAIIVGGSGNNFGVMVGALLVPVAFLEATRFLPQIGRPGLVDALQWIVVGLLALIFLWFWPRGIVPERRRRFRADPSDEAVSVPGARLAWRRGR